MKIRRVLSTVIAPLGAAVILAGCGAGAAVSTPSATPIASTKTTTPTPTASPAPTGASASALVVGTCRPVSGTAPIPAIYSVRSQDERPLTVTVDAFDSDGSSTKQTITAAGPAVTIVSWDDCRSTGVSVPWHLQASYADGKSGTISCSLASYNGQVGRPESRDGESGSTDPVTCEGVLNGA